MAYETYITDALVVAAFPKNTSDVACRLFTREAGMLVAYAKSAREERSKHRFGLQEFSLARVSLISGKAGWRVVGVEPVVNTFLLQTSRTGRAQVCMVVRTIRRFVRGEEPNRALFDEVRELLRAPLGPDAEALVTVSHARMFALLGYVAPPARTAALFECTSPQEAARAASLAEVRWCKEAIEAARTSSQL